MMPLVCIIKYKLIFRHSSLLNLQVFVYVNHNFSKLLSIIQETSLCPLTLTYATEQCTFMPSRAYINFTISCFDSIDFKNTQSKQIQVCLIFKKKSHK